jgi:hypothetical protein
MNNKKIYTVIILIAIVFTQSSYAQNNQITAVDLGLSIMWADRNLGAAFPEEYGNYYAWGEIATKSVFSWDTYYGSDNFREHLDKTEDVASVKLSDHWRMPTLEEIEELTKNCYFYKTTLKGVNVILVTSKINGKRIILPEAGYYDGSDRGQEFRTGVAIWSSSMNRGVPARSFTLRVYKVANDLVASYMDSPRCNGLPIRPVREKQGATHNTSIGDKRDNTTSTNSYYDNSNSSAETYVDLGLPSGTLWKSAAEIGFYDYDAALKKFGNKIPSYEQFEELKDICSWDWNGVGYTVSGRNGNSIILEAAGWRDSKGKKKPCWYRWRLLDE